MMSSLESLHLRLADFEGPLPLLLHLIESNELEVTRVSVAAVADQFLALVATLGASDLSTTGEFVAAAARLLLIKSRALLFHRGASDTDLEQQDDADVLARQIAEYARFQTAARALGLRLDSELHTRPRPPRIADRVSAARPPAVHPAVLLRAARRLLAITQRADAEQDPWPDVVFASLKVELLAQLRRLRETTFAVLCKNAWHPLVVITMFLALLDAVRAEQLCISQADAFGPITISLPASDGARA